MKEISNRRWLKKVIVILFIITLTCLIYIGMNIFNNAFEFKNVTVIGNEYYTEQEIRTVLNMDKYKNTLIFYMMKQNFPAKEIPFINALSIKLEAPDTIKVEVFEKTFIGCVEYMGMYFYFDKDGMVVEISENKVDDIPVVLGLNYNSLVLHQKIPVENDSVFEVILQLMQLLREQNINIDKISFESNNMVIFVKDLRINLGQGDQLNEKIIQLKGILPQLMNKKGQLNIDKVDQKIFFKEDN